MNNKSCIAFALDCSIDIIYLRQIYISVFSIIKNINPDYHIKIFILFSEKKIVDCHPNK